MATHPGTINTRQQLRYLDRNELDPVQQVQRNYYRELIHSYGVDAIYFRHDVDAFNDALALSAKNFDFIYGEQTATSYWLSAPIVIYMVSQGDTLLMNKFGQETDGDMDSYVLIDDFTEGFRDLVGLSANNTFSDTVSSSVTSGSASFLYDIINSDLSGYTSASNIFASSGVVSAEFTTTYIRYPKLYSDYMYHSEAYTDRVVLGSIYTFLSGTLDNQLNGTINGSISGDLDYYTEQSRDGGGPNWKISPKVGDFFRLDFHDENHEEYEITSLVDRNLQTEGINPLLDKYIWHMTCNRRDPSHEDVIGSPESTLPDLTGVDGILDEIFTADKFYSNEKIEETSNDEIFDYSEDAIDEYDPAGSDKIYGFYDIS